jgi:hypothetical protein
MLSISRSLLNREYVLMNVLKVLASIISIYNLHVIFLSKITPIQYKATLRRSTTTREVDPPSLILIYLDTPTLTPGLH